MMLTLCIIPLMPQPVCFISSLLLRFHKQDVVWWARYCLTVGFLLVEVLAKEIRELDMGLAGIMRNANDEA